MTNDQFLNIAFEKMHCTICTICTLEGESAESANFYRTGVNSSSVMIREVRLVNNYQQSETIIFFFLHVFSTVRREQARPRPFCK